MSKYMPKEFEQKWVEEWQKLQLHTKPSIKKGDKKFYSLYSFPYPSGAGLHVGHVEGMVANDIAARFARMQGVATVLPMGWDSFGLPAENYAIKTGIHPKDSTDEVVVTFKDQINNIGISVDWNTEVGAHWPEYYKWTQWIFLQLYKKGLAYQKEAAVNWCPKDNTVLANEQVVDGKCERCDSEVVQKKMKQWFFKITEYAEQLEKDLDTVDWPKSTKDQQRNWIGKSVGAEIDFAVEGTNKKIRVFSTRPDTIFGATYMVLAPEHPLLAEITTEAQKKSVEEYIIQTKKKTELQRIGLEKEKTGVFTGAYAINPVNNEKIPVWIADYVLITYGTGAIMAVPAHDERDYAFAMQFNLPLKPVVAPVNNEMDVQYSSEKTARLIEQLKNMLAVAQEHGKELMIWGGMAAEIHAVSSYREHEDLDIWIWKDDIAFWKEQLENEGYKIELYPAFEQMNDDYAFTAKKGDVHIDLGAITLNDQKQVVWLEDKEMQTPQYLFDEYFTRTEWKGYTVTTLQKDQVKRWMRTEGKHTQRWKDAYDFLMLGYQPYVQAGIVINSSELDGLTTDEAKKKAIALIESKKAGMAKTTYRLRDWLVSRQRYWGAPIPVVYDPEGNPHPVDESDLPVLLPYNVDFKPTGESPLKYSEEFHKSAEEKYGKGWRREVDTMDTFVDSSWYFFRHLSAGDDRQAFDPETANAWLPTDLYMIGAEHIVLHLLYSRFFTKVFNDAGLIDFNEPFHKMRHMGTILGPDGRKMSKRWGNVINPTDVINDFGADTLRVYEMFMGPLDQMKPWNTQNVQGAYRFLMRIWKLYTSGTAIDDAQEDKAVAVKLQKTIQKVTEDIPELKFNTSIAAMMELLNVWEGKAVSTENAKKFLQILAPFAPFIAEELWHQVMGEKSSIHISRWPVADLSGAESEAITIPVQINGKVKSTITVPSNADKDTVITAAMGDSKIAPLVAGKEPKVIYVPGRIVNLLVKG